MSSVSVEIRVGGSGNSIVSPNGTAAKLSVGDQNTGVNNVGKGTGSRSAIVDVVVAGSTAVRDGTKTPRREGSLGDLFIGLELWSIEWLDMELWNLQGPEWS